MHCASVKTIVDFCYKYSCSWRIYINDEWFNGVWLLHVISTRCKCVPPILRNCKFLARKRPLAATPNEQTLPTLFIISSFAFIAISISAARPILVLSFLFLSCLDLLFVNSFTLWTELKYCSPDVKNNHIINLLYVPIILAHLFTPFGFLTPKDFHIIWLWAYLMKVAPETRRPL